MTQGSSTARSTARASGWMWLGVFAVITLVAATIAWPYVCARAIESRLQGWVQTSDPDGEWVWQHLVHERGWLSSRGSVELVVRARCSPDAALRQGGVLRLSYELLHWPTWRSASQFSWQLRPADTAQGRVVSALLGTALPASGEGEIGWDRSVRSSFHLPSWRIDAAQMRWRGAPLHGQLAWTEAGLLAQTRIEQLSAQRGNWSTRAQGVDVQVNWPPGPTGLGDVTLKAAALKGPNWEIQDLSLATHARHDEHKLALQLRQRIRQVHWREQALRDLQLDVALKDVDERSAYALGGIFSQSCRLERLSPDDGNRWRAALRALLSQGLSIEVSKLAARHDGVANVVSSGELEGSWSIGLLPSPHADQVWVADSLVSQGVLNIRGNVLAPTLRESALASGFFSATADGMQGSYRYAQGRLIVREQSQDLPTFRQWLGVLDQAIQSWLSPQQPGQAAAEDEPDVAPPSAWPEPPQAASEPASAAASAP